jgi:hypothetical protein
MLSEPVNRKNTGGKPRYFSKPSVYRGKFVLMGAGNRSGKTAVNRQFYSGFYNMG